MAQRQEAGGKRRPLSATAQPLRGDHRGSASGGENSRADRHEMKRALFTGVLLAILAIGASAHEVRPAYLELRETGPDTFDALWKVPGQGENLRLGLYVELPEGCANVTHPRATMV